MAAPFGAIEAVLGHVGLATQDGLAAVLPRLHVEIQGAEEIAVIRHGNLLHAHGQGLGEQLVEADGTIEQAVLRMKVQMRETGHAACEGLPVRTGEVNEHESC